ncbi:dinitrogenase iron-molybdenum cofactor biosynthesis protein [Malaciobacter molluscorum LMG 25693]|uniref:Dinitrogenase iron-molybdenum cofactor biosynthesis protein n=1 Tax=Malaciobacter molluscorum LMG 25693 TaxID=870501 RepID=A0A2G1DIY3_9BACT|nr:NifB/NifX family molybdenum-iron cluster-binding protein [Malaciobacter molluscorum]AXX93211.1 nitrogen fixation protein NifX [Malaciobacter molluscorum LMG 25693]PHO18465.1 dinitrogenase iron-molybdenum cofactor biosynthesis protein [Malaciobacter molluscorum LMG 25693]
MNSIEIKSNNETQGVLKVGFATTDLSSIDSHFGSAKQFVVYEISKLSTSLCKIVKVTPKQTDETVKALKGIDIVYFTNIGATAAAKLINNGIFTIKYKEIIQIDKEVEKLKEMLNTNPPPFIKKIVEKKVA